MPQARHSYLEGSVNWKQFGKLVQKQIKDSQMSYRDLAVDLEGPSHPTLNRIAHGRPCTVEMYLWICHEFAIDPYAAFRRPK
jgi:hypothetical protein